MGTRPVLSLVLPIFNEEETIPELDKRLRAFVAEIGETWEVVFVDDGSTDRSLAMLAELAAKEPRYKIIALSRNFGHQLAITAGTDVASGDAVVVMDADLQDPPEVVHQMIARWKEGADVVYAVRMRREKETLFKRITAAVFYRVIARIIHVKIPLDAGDFRLMSRRVVLTLRALRETHRLVRLMVAWLGFNQASIYYARPERFAGETKYPLSKMLKLAIDGITSFSIIPLRFASWFGILAGLFGIGTGTWALYEKLYGHTVQGWTTLMIVVSLAASGQFLMIGVLGEYVGRIYEEVKRRPLYVVAREINIAPRPLGTHPSTSMAPRPIDIEPD